MPDVDLYEYICNFMTYCTIS